MTKEITDTWNSLVLLYISSILPSEKICLVCTANAETLISFSELLHPNKPFYFRTKKIRVRGCTGARWLRLTFPKLDAFAFPEFRFSPRKAKTKISFSVRLEQYLLSLQNFPTAFFAEGALGAVAPIFSGAYRSPQKKRERIPSLERSSYFTPLSCWT